MKYKFEQNVNMKKEQTVAHLKENKILQKSKNIKYCFPKNSEIKKKNIKNAFPIKHGNPKIYFSQKSLIKN